MPQSQGWSPSEKQLKRLFAIAKSSGWTNAQVKDELERTYGITSTSELNREQYDSFTEFLETTTPPLDGGALTTDSQASFDDTWPEGRE
jgi:hypothetical protein